MKEHENIVLCGYWLSCAIFFDIGELLYKYKSEFKKVSLYKPHLTPCWPCPAKQ